MKFDREHYLAIARDWRFIVMERLQDASEKMRHLWRDSVTEGHELMSEIRDINWSKEAIRLFDRLSNATHLYLTSSLVLGSCVMWYSGVPSGLLVVSLMIIPLIMLKLTVQVANYLEYDKACEEHFTRLMDTCLKHWEHSGTFREHLTRLLAMMDEAHAAMDQAEPRMNRAYRLYYAKHQKRINAHLLMVFGFPVSAHDLQGETCAVSRMMCMSSRMRHVWEAEFGPYLKDKPLQMEQLMWLMHRLPVVFDLR